MAEVPAGEQPTEPEPVSAETEAPRTGSEPAPRQRSPGLRWLPPGGPDTTAAAVVEELTEERLRRVLAENAALSQQLKSSDRELREARSLEEELQAASQAAEATAQRAKTYGGRLAQQSQQQRREDTQRLVEAAQNVRDLQDVHKELMIVNRQLGHATKQKEQALEESSNKLAAQCKHIQRITHALYSIVCRAQQVEDSSWNCAPGKPRELVSQLVSECSTEARKAISQEAQREALQLLADGNSKSSSPELPELG